MERLGVEKLNGQNYCSWKQQAEFLLIREDLWRYIVGTKPAPVRAAASNSGSTGAASAGQVLNAAEIDAWDSGDQRARATIGLLLEKSKLPLIKNATTAKLCWNALKDHFETVTLTTKVALLKRLCGMHYVEDEDIQDHIQQMEEIFERLTMAGQQLDEDLCVAMVLRSLPDSFDALTTALEARSDDELTLELVKMKLLDEVAKRGNRGSSESVLKVKQKKVLVCNFCKKAGHREKYCWIKNGESSEEEAKPDLSKAKMAHEENFSFLMLEQKSDRDVWIIDSGATSHMCVNPEYFVSMDKTVKQEIFLANGRKTTTEGVGSCKLVWESPEGRRYNVVLSDVLYVPNFKTNLISVKKLTAFGVKVNFDADGCRILKDKKVIGTATMVGGLYKLKTIHEAQRVLATRVETRNFGRKVVKRAKRAMPPNDIVLNTPETPGRQEEINSHHEVSERKPTSCKWVRNSDVLRNLEYQPSEAKQCLCVRTKAEEEYELVEGSCVPETTAKGGGTAALEDYQPLVGALLYVVVSYVAALVANGDEVIIVGQAGGAEEGANRFPTNSA